MMEASEGGRLEIATGSGKSRAGVALLILALAVSGVVLLIGYNVKDLCTRHVWDGYQYRTLCYNDVFALYSFRGLDVQPFPYIHGDGIFDNEHRPDGSTIEAGDLEYPVLTGVFIGAVAEFTHNGVQFFRATSIALALMALMSVVLLWNVVRDKRRLFYFAAAPALALYAFHNWDLLAVLFMCIGLWAFARRSDTQAGIWLGLGAAAKVFPGLIIPALVIARKKEGERWGRMIVAAAASFIGVNLPFAIINRTGWWAPWHFQSTRFPNFETSWFNIYRHLAPHFPGSFWATTYPGLTSYASAALFVAGISLLLWRESKRGVFRPYTASFGILIIWLLTAKVYSPQYALWLIPLFVLVEIPLSGFVAFTVSDFAVWVTVSALFLSFPLDQGGIGLGNEARMTTLLEVMVWARYAVLIWLLWLSRRAGENVPEQPSEPLAPASMMAAPVEFPA